MIVSLSYITGIDWRPYFDMFGLYYSDFANSQVDANKPTSVIKPVLYVDKTDSSLSPGLSLSADPNIVMLDMTNKDTDFAGKKWACQ